MLSNIEFRLLITELIQYWNELFTNAIQSSAIKYTNIYLKYTNIYYLFVWRRIFYVYCIFHSYCYKLFFCAYWFYLISMCLLLFVDWRITIIVRCLKFEVWNKRELKVVVKSFHANINFCSEIKIKKTRTV